MLVTLLKTADGFTIAVDGVSSLMPSPSRQNFDIATSFSPRRRVAIGIPSCQPLKSSLQTIFPQLENNDTAVPDCDVADDSLIVDDIVTEELNLAPQLDEKGLSADDDLHWFRFGGVGRLYEDDEKPEDLVLDRLKKATVAVVGMGGIGSWTAEALSRSGIGNLVLMDLDDICISNTNRQLHTLSTNVGFMKTDVMRDRLVGINPFSNITLIHDFVMLDNVQEVVGQTLKKLNVDVIIDAIDGDEEKAALIAACKEHGIPVVTTGSPAGKTDPTQIACDDLTNVRGDGILKSCCDRLVNDYNFPLELVDGKVSDQQAPWNIVAVYSKQGGTMKETYDSVGSTSLASSFRNDGNLGTACFVTGTFGFVAASRVVEMIVQETLIPPSFT